MTTGISFLDIINKQLTSEKARLPVFSMTAMKIRRELVNEDPDPRKVEKLIISDQALTSEVLKMANSAFFKGLFQVDTVRDAIFRLGLKQIGDLVLLASHKKNYLTKDPALRPTLTTLWRHSVMTAIGARGLAVQCDFATIRDEAFFAGLLHDVGKLFLLTVIEDMRRSKKIRFDPSPTLVAEIVHNLHAGHGHTLLQQWNIPEKYCVVARDHHVEDPDPCNTLLLVVRLVDKACNKLSIGLNPQPDITLAASPEAGLLDLTEVDVAELEIRIEDSLSLAG